MTLRRYTDTERAEIAAVIEAGEAHAKAQRERAAAIRKARRDIRRLVREGILPPPDAA